MMMMMAENLFRLLMRNRNGNLIEENENGKTFLHTYTQGNKRGQIFSYFCV